MPEFKVKCYYYGVSKKKFFRDQEPVEYHKFSVKNPEKLPHQSFHSSTRLGKGNRNTSFEGMNYCWLFILTNLVKKANLNFKVNQKYRFIMKLGEPKTADFTIYYYIPPAGYEYEEHSMILKTKQYFENTVKKIGFWGSENYFYEVGKKENPPKPNHSNPNQPSNKNIGVKIVLICLPFLILGLFLLLLIRWVSRRKKLS